MIEGLIAIVFLSVVWLLPAFVALFVALQHQVYTLKEIHQRLDRLEKGSRE